MKCLGASRHSFGNVNVSQIKLEFGSAGFWAEQKTGVPGEKPLEARTKTNNKLYPHVINAKTWTRAIHWWEATVHPTSWVPNLNINTLIPYTVHYQFFLILVVLFSLFLLTLTTCMFDQARIIQEEKKCQHLWLQYNTHRPDLSSGGAGTNGNHRSHVHYLTIPTHSYN